MKMKIMIIKIIITLMNIKKNYNDEIISVTATTTTMMMIILNNDDHNNGNENKSKDGNSKG